MKRHLIFLFFIGLSVSQIYAQDHKFSKGAYMSFEEIVNKIPSNQLALTVEKRTPGDIKMNGGNDYKLVSADKTIDKSFLKREILAYSLGDTLYLNSFTYKLQPWYSAILSDGKYLVFKAGISQNQDEFKRQMQMASMFGAAGGAFAGAKLAMLRFLYVVDKSTNKVTTVNPKSLETLLASNQELLNLYLNEPTKNDEATQLMYLKLLNGL